MTTARRHRAAPAGAWTSGAGPSAAPVEPRSREPTPSSWLTCRGGSHGGVSDGGSRHSGPWGGVGHDRFVLAPAVHARCSGAAVWLRSTSWTPAGPEQVRHAAHQGRGAVRNGKRLARTAARDDARAQRGFVSQRVAVHAYGASRDGRSAVRGRGSGGVATECKAHVVPRCRQRGTHACRVWRIRAPHTCARQNTGTKAPQHTTCTHGSHWRAVRHGTRCMARAYKKCAPAPQLLASREPRTPSCVPRRRGPNPTLWMRRNAPQCIWRPSGSVGARWWLGGVGHVCYMGRAG